MKIFFYNELGDVTDSFDLAPHNTNEQYVVQEEPDYIPKDGFYGVLRCVDGQLNWEYIPVDAEKDISGQQLSQMLEEVI